MKSLLICPVKRPGVRLLSRDAPLSNIPLLGESLVEYWLSHLACSGVHQALILARDRSAQVRAVVGDGARWGMRVEVIETARELNPTQALLKYDRKSSPGSHHNRVNVLDHLPGQPERPLFLNYASWFAGLIAWIERAQTPDRVGIRQPRAGVWTSVSARISRRAELRAPCWIGKNVVVGPRAVIGPNVIIEDRVVLDPDVELVESWIGPDTFVGRYAQLSHSLAFGSTLLNWATDSVTEIPDSFLLCSLRAHPQSIARPSPVRGSAAETPVHGELSWLWKTLLSPK
jgi:NDP-sugar pyrophosphorylase family protein